MTVAVTGCIAQTVVWIYVAVLITQAYERDMGNAGAPTGEFYEGLPALS